MVIGGKGKNESKLVTLEISFISDHNYTQNVQYPHCIKTFQL